MGALKAELAAAKRTEGSGGTPGRTSEMMNMQRQILEKMPGLSSGSSGDGGAEVLSLRQQLEQSRSDTQDARSMVQQLRQQVHDRFWLYFVYSRLNRPPQVQQQQSTSRDSGSSTESETLKRENSQLKQELQVGSLSTAVHLCLMHATAAIEVETCRCTRRCG